MSKILSSGVDHNPRQRELSPDEIGYTVFDKASQQVLEIAVTPDPLVRVHEFLHALHSPGGTRFGKSQPVQDFVEDMRLHCHHWLWEPGNTPGVVRDPALKQLYNEQSYIRGALERDNEARGAGVAMSIRNAIVAHSVSGRPVEFPVWFTAGEHNMAEDVYSAILDEDYELAADILDKFDIKPSSVRRLIKRRLPEREPVVHIDDDGPFNVPCGNTDEIFELVNATTGSRINRPLLRRPVLPQRLFWKLRPLHFVGDSILIDASGSMCMGAADIVRLTTENPHGVIALYSGNDVESAPEGTIYVVAKDGYRREIGMIEDYVNNRDGGNSIDLAAIEWLLEQPGPRIMLTDRVFCGAADKYIKAAKKKLHKAIEEKTIRWIKDAEELKPKPQPSASEG